MYISKLVSPTRATVSFLLIEKYHAAVAVRAPSVCIVDVQKVAHEKVRDTSRGREREEEDEGGRLSHHPIVQSRASACCFGNVMSVQPLATPLRLASFQHRGVCVSVYLCLSLEVVTQTTLV